MAVGMITLIAGVAVGGGTASAAQTGPHAAGSHTAGYPTGAARPDRVTARGAGQATRLRQTSGPADPLPSPCTQAGAAGAGLARVANPQ